MDIIKLILFYIGMVCFVVVMESLGLISLLAEATLLGVIVGNGLAMIQMEMG